MLATFSTKLRKVGFSWSLWKVLGSETEQDWHFRVPRIQYGLIGQRRDPRERKYKSEALEGVFARFLGMYREKWSIWDGDGCGGV